MWLFPCNEPNRLLFGACGLSSTLKEVSSTLRSGNSEKEALDPGEFGEAGYLPCKAGDILDGKYALVKALGSGQSSQVWLAHNLASCEAVALKIYRCEEKLKESMNYEKMLLEFIHNRCGDNIGVAAVKGGFEYEGPYGSHAALAFEVMGSPLDVLMSDYGFQGMEKKVVVGILTSVLKTLTALEIAHVTHMDLKPENMLLAAPSPEVCQLMGLTDEDVVKKYSDPFAVKLVDFGLSYLEPPHVRRGTASRLTKAEQELLYVGNYEKGAIIQTREYRAPEIILGMDFSSRSDIWSLGCVAYELVTGQFLFDPKSSPTVTDEHEMDIQHICDIIHVNGLPSKDFLKKGGAYLSKFFNNGTFKYAALLKAERRNLETEVREYLGDEAPTFVSFLRSCLAWDPVNRMSPSLLQRHRWLTS